MGTQCIALSYKQKMFTRLTSGKRGKVSTKFLKKWKNIFSSKFTFQSLHPLRLHHPLDGVTNPEYKLLRFIQLTIFLQKVEGTSL
jgi:hypothetical protein